MAILCIKKRTITRRLTLVLLITFSFLIILAEAIGQESLFFAFSPPTEWSPASSVLRSTGFSAHSLVMIGDDIYLIGGAYSPPNGTISVVYSDIYHARVYSNGYITGWNRIGDYPLVKVAYAGTTVDNNGTVYVTGGLKDPETYTSDTRCTTPTNGTISQWKLAPVTVSFSARYGHAASIVGNKLYVLGGMRLAPLTDVSYAEIGSAQCLTTGSWTSTRPLEPPTGRLGHAALEFEGRIYIIGGLTRTAGNWVPLASVYFAQPTGTGAITQWIPTEPLTHGLAYPAAFVVSPTRKIYVMGGWMGGAVVTDVVYSAYINQDGTLAKWKESSLRLPDSLHRHSAVVGDSGGVYLVGGQKTRRDDYTNHTYYIPPLVLTKSNDPSGPVHEGDIITYTITYANTSLITQTMTITDVLPFNVTLIPDSVSPPAIRQGSMLLWDLGNVPPGGSGEVSFQVRVPLLPSLHGESVTPLCPPTPPPPARVLPVPIVCDTTRFWANGVTRQPPVPNPHTIEVVIPPGTSPSEMWLLMKGTGHTPPTVGGNPAHLVKTSTNSFGASLWRAPITSEMVASGEVTVITYNPRELNALFLFDEDDPPFDEAALDDFCNTTKTFTYTLDMPSVITQTMDVILPFMDITYWTDDLLPDDRMTTVTVEFDGQSYTVAANDPNLGNGLLMTQFPLTIGFVSGTVASKVLTVTVDTEDSVYTLGPRVCRPVYIENTAWLCSLQAGCISDTATNIPEGFMPYGSGGLYLPIILKSYP